MGKVRNVLFLCSGNTSRSPGAEYIAKWLKETKFSDDLKNINFDSAGLYSYFKTPREGTAIYLKSKGIDFSDFEGKQIDEDLLLKQDIILGFEEKWHIREEYQKVMEKIEFGVERALKKIIEINKEVEKDN